ncbi:MAG: class I tRNA ligase family protein, partial [Planctomycetes bacterium]|nr:class I tRNA ligase family protein [Planctomycetota bacterium]
DPKTSTSAAGYRVAAPEQACPKCAKELCSAYGVATGLAVPTEDKPLAMNSSSKFDLGRNFANKLWNAVRFALGNLTEGEVDTPPMREWKDTLPLADRWIITRLHRTQRTVEDAVANYQFSVYAETMYDFIWRDFCDWYLEAIKPTVKENPIQQQVLRTVLNAILRLLHPICPFVTEALWPHVQAAGSAGMDGITLPPNEVLARADWPEIDDSTEDGEAVKLFERARSLSEAIRTIRGEKQISPKKKIDLHASKPLITLINAADGIVQTATGLGSVTESTDRPKDALTLSFEGEQLYLTGLSETINVAEEHIRQKKLVEELQKAVAGYRNKLQNDNYVKRAPPNVVQETRERMAQAQRDLIAAEKVLESLPT